MNSNNIKSLGQLAGPYVSYFGFRLNKKASQQLSYDARNFFQES